MATSGRLSFTVRRLLDLPEQDAQHLRKREPELSAPEPGPCATWLESERGHYPSSDESSPEASPRDSSQRPAAAAEVRAAPGLLRRVVVPVLVRDGQPCGGSAEGGTAAARDKSAAPPAAACPVPGYAAFGPGSAFGLFPAYQHLAPPALVSWNW
nr:PREDICTED: homeobox protein Nkx-2.8 [Bos indicus]